MLKIGQFVKIKKQKYYQEWYHEKPMKIIGIDLKNSRKRYVVNHIFYSSKTRNYSKAVDSYPVVIELMNLILCDLVEQDKECIMIEREEKLKRLIN